MTPSFYGILFAAYLVTLSAAQLAEFYAYALAAAALPASYISHFIMSDALGNLALGQAEDSAEWFLHRHLSTWIPYVADMTLGSRAIVVNYLIQGLQQPGCHTGNGGELSRWPCNSHQRVAH